MALCDSSVPQGDFGRYSPSFLIRIDQKSAVEPPERSSPPFERRRDAPHCGQAV
jgi:hypothetical protein